MKSSKVTVMFVAILSLILTSVMCAVVRDPYYDDYLEGFKSVSGTPRDRQFGLRNDHYGRETATRRRSDHHNHKHNSDTAFYFHRRGQAHFYPPIAVLGG